MYSLSGDRVDAEPEHALLALLVSQVPLSPLSPSSPPVFFTHVYTFYADCPLPGVLLPQAPHINCDLPL